MSLRWPTPWRGTYKPPRAGPPPSHAPLHQEFICPQSLPPAMLALPRVRRPVLPGNRPFNPSSSNAEPTIPTAHVDSTLADAEDLDIDFPEDDPAYPYIVEAARVAGRERAASAQQTRTHATATNRTASSRRRSSSGIYMPANASTSSRLRTPPSHPSSDPNTAGIVYDEWLPPSPPRSSRPARSGGLRPR